jgi:hypothetical protein
LLLLLLLMLTVLILLLVPAVENGRDDSLALALETVVLGLYQCDLLSPPLLGLIQVLFAILLGPVAANLERK